MNANETTIETVSIDTFKGEVHKFGPAGLRRLALITVLDANKPEIVFSAEKNAAPKYDGSNELLGATNLDGGFVIMGRQRSQDDDDTAMVRYEAVVTMIPKAGQTMACAAIVDETLDDIVYELYNDSGEATEIDGLVNTELVDQKLQIQGFAFENGNDVDIYVGNFRQAVEGFKNDEYFDGLKFITTAPKETKLVRMDGKVALKLPDGELQVFNLDGTVDTAYSNLPKIPPSTMVLQAIDENGDFKQGWVITKYYGDEDIVSYAANAQTEADDELKKFLEDWNNTPIGKTQQKMHAAPETYRAK